MSSFFEKMQKDKQQIRNKFSRKMKQSSFMKRSLSLKQTREFEEKIELEKLTEQTENFLQDKNKILREIEHECQTQVQHIGCIFDDVISKVVKKFEDYKNNMINKCIIYMQSFKKNLKFLEHEVQSFKKVDSDFSNSIYKGQSEKFKIYHKEQNTKKLFREEKVFQYFYLNKLQILQQKKLIDSMSQFLKKSVQHFPKFAEASSAEEMVKEDIDQILKIIDEKLKSFSIYFMDYNLPNFETFQGKFIFSPIIGQNGHQIFYNDISFKNLCINKMDSIEKLNCISVNGENKIFMGLQNGQILRFNPTEKNFEKELCFSNSEVKCITPIQSYQQYFDNNANNFFQMSKKKEKKLLKNFIITYQQQGNDNDLFLWDLQRNSIVKRYNCLQGQEIKDVVVLNDYLSFLIYTNSNIYFYLLNEIKSTFSIELKDVVKIFVINDKNIIVWTSENVQKYKISKKYKENIGKKYPFNVKLQNQIVLQEKINDIISDQENLILLNDKKLKLYSQDTFTQRKEINLDNYYTNILTLKDVSVSHQYFLLIGQQKIQLMKDQKIIKEVILDMSQMNIKNLANLMFINFKENFKVLFISKNDREEKKYIYEISFNQFLFIDLQ